MSPRLPNVTTKDTQHAFERAGLAFVGQRGNHVRLQNAQGVMLVIPVHSGDIKRPLLKAAIKQASMSEKEFRALL